ncbi:SAF domain-containing protein [Corynebacterium flavescens]|uniref:SAF domain-containing protein n=1 Tax=Corynebacterium flavescens TaxID=28028 RepID=UPI003FD3F13A
MNNRHLRSFLRTLTTPGHHRLLLVRRLVAALLVVAAGVSYAGTLKEQPSALVFAADVPAGKRIGPGDLKAARLPAQAIPESALHGAPADFEGRVVVAAAGRGEILSAARILDEHLAASLVSESTESEITPNAHMVPLKLAEPDLIPHLHHGDEVNVVSAVDKPELDEPRAAVIAAGGRVITAGGGKEGEKPTSVLLALPQRGAEAVAAASLSQPLTVVIVGSRAQAPQFS